MNSITDTILVSINLSRNKENAILIVGRKKPREAVDVINAFDGEEALELYKKLITPKAKNE